MPLRIYTGGTAFTPSSKGVKGFVLLCLGALLLGFLASAKAQDLPVSNQPALLQADEVTYDRNARTVTARGNVEVVQEERILQTDTLRYNLATDVITARGNVALLEPDGEVLFADYMQLTGDLREGAISAIRILLTDRSRLAAASATRTGGDRTELNRAVFSPCQLCKEDPTRPPLWQLKAVKVIHDQEAQVIQYRDAWLEMFGVPVLYTPFFQHPDPTVDRQSGLLTPSFRNAAETVGFAVQPRYYWAISPHEDATFEPIFSTKKNPLFVGEYRRRFADGRIDLRGSGSIQDREVAGNRTEKDVVRGHVDATGRFDINERWRWGFDVNRASDDTFLRLYDFAKENDRTLTSRLFAERFEGRDYLAINGYSFQGMRRDQTDRQPLVTPEIDYNYESEPGVAGGTYFVDANLMNLNRLDGRDSRRISLAGGWTLPYTSSYGLQTTLTASLRADGYWTNGVNPGSNAVAPPEPQAQGNDLTGRVFPQVALQARYPFVRHSQSFSQIIEPIAQVVAAPDAGNPDDIPNEDSLDFEFDDTNLLDANRFPGLDRVDTGQRFDYGLKYALTTDESGYGEVFLGQSYRLAGGEDFARGSGVRDGISDVVGRVLIEPRRHLNLSYRFRLDDDGLKPRRHEADLRAGPPLLNVRLGYSFFDGGVAFQDREELRARVATQINQYWSAFASHRHDLAARDPLKTRVGLTYEDECFQISVIGERNYFRDREIEKGDSVFVTFGLKHLGVFGEGR